MDADAQARPDFRVDATGTLLHHRILEVTQRFPDIDLMVLHLGGTRVLGLLLIARYSSCHSKTSAAPQAANLPSDVHYVGRGETITVEAAGG
jgi:hypothetical protein